MSSVTPAQRGQAPASEAAIRMGYEPSIDVLPTKRAQQMTAEGSYSALFTVTKSKKREKYCLFSDPITHIADVFFKRKSDKITWARLEDIGKRIVGATDGYNYAPVFQEAVRHGQLKLDLIASKHPELQHLRKLVVNRIDVTICERSVCSYLITKHRPEFNSLDFIPKPIGPVRSFHVCFSRKWPDAELLVSQFNITLEKMRNEGTVKAILNRNGVIDFNQ